MAFRISDIVGKFAMKARVIGSSPVGIVINEYA
jgi:hypothetical protein